VYWMFYSGGDFEPVAAPQGLPGAAAGAAVEGLRMRPGLAMSQVRKGWVGMHVRCITPAEATAGVHVQTNGSSEVCNAVQTLDSVAQCTCAAWATQPLASTATASQATAVAALTLQLTLLLCDFAGR
jgi:hypothetical protein